MSKLRTSSSTIPHVSRSEEFHRKLEKGIRTAQVHSKKVEQDEKEAQTVSDVARARERAQREASQH